MDFLNDIKKDTLIICNTSVKNKIISIKKLLPIRVMDISDFIKKYYFDFDENTIMYLVNKYGYNYDVAEDYIKNLYYIRDSKTGIHKLDFLYDIKKELDDKKLLIYNDSFREYIKNIDIILYNIKEDKMVKYLFNNLNYKIVTKKYNYYKHTIYSFPSMDLEIEYVAYNICKLIDSGINIDKIVLTNVDSSYYNTLEKVFNLFNLRVDIPYTAKLSSYKIVKDFLSYYKNYSLEEALEKVNDNSDAFDILINTINKYLKYDSKELLMYKVSNAMIPRKRISNSIKIVDYLEYDFDEEEYVFMLGFNDGIIPNSYKDIEYINDDIKENTLLENTRILNCELRDNIINILGDIKNLTITYKDRDLKKGYYPSTLCSYFEVKQGEVPCNISYSSVYDEIKLMKMYDEYFKYGVINSNFKVLNNNFKINYNSFFNKYHKINRKFAGLTLSYSKMQIYNKCAFRYYLSEILKLDIFEENFSTVIGSMVHYVMEKCLSNNDEDILKYVNEYLGDRKLTKKEHFFLDKYVEAIHGLLEQVMLEKEYTLFNQALYEKKINIDYGDGVQFVGIIDKILYYIDNNTTYVGLIDYKTGNDIIDLKYLKYGLDMQLPIYLYLSTRLDFINPLYAGFYLQKFNIKDKDYRLVGYSNSNKDILSIMDNNYDNSKIIKGMKTLKDGSFSRYAKTLDNDSIKAIIKITEEKIFEVIDNIKNNNFDINPKVVDGIDKGCEYCKFRDICFVEKKDKVEIITNEADNEEDMNGEY